MGHFRSGELPDEDCRRAWPSEGVLLTSHYHRQLGFCGTEPGGTESVRDSPFLALQHLVVL